MKQIKYIDNPHYKEDSATLLDQNKIKFQRLEQDIHAAETAGQNTDQLIADRNACIQQTYMLKVLHMDKKIKTTDRDTALAFKELDLSAYKDASDVYALWYKIETNTISAHNAEKTLNPSYDPDWEQKRQEIHAEWKTTKEQLTSTLQAQASRPEIQSLQEHIGTLEERYFHYQDVAQFQTIPEIAHNIIADKKALAGKLSAGDENQKIKSKIIFDAISTYERQDLDGLSTLEEVEALWHECAGRLPTGQPKGLSAFKEATFVKTEFTHQKIFGEKANEPEKMLPILYAEDIAGQEHHICIKGGSAVERYTAEIASAIRDEIKEKSPEAISSLKKIWYTHTTEDAQVKNEEFTQVSLEYNSQTEQYDMPYDEKTRFASIPGSLVNIFKKSVNFIFGKKTTPAQADTKPAAAAEPEAALH